MPDPDLPMLPLPAQMAGPQRWGELCQQVRGELCQQPSQMGVNSDRRLSQLVVARACDAAWERAANSGKLYYRRVNA